MRGRPQLRDSLLLCRQGSLKNQEVLTAATEQGCLDRDVGHRGSGQPQAGPLGPGKLEDSFYMLATELDLHSTHMSSTSRRDSYLLSLQLCSRNALSMGGFSFQPPPSLFHGLKHHKHIGATSSNLHFSNPHPWRAISSCWASMPGTCTELFKNTTKIPKPLLLKAVGSSAPGGEPQAGGLCCRSLPRSCTTP